MSAFTPGPWHYTQFLNDPRPCLVWNADSSRCICDVHNAPGTRGAVAEADARLIAAAPDLLEALKRAYLILCNNAIDLDCDAAIDQARAAIAKALGDHCNYPECKCPFDAPEDPKWCARGLPQKEAA